jgi:hypothetical protein
MKTTSTVFIKKAIRTGIVVIMLVVSTAFINKDKKNLNDKPQYCVAVGWEYMGNDLDSQPVISNVVYVDCKYYEGMHVTNELNSYYTAYYAKNRGSYGLKQMVAFNYDTRDAAIRKRRELVANYNQKWNPLLITDFTVTCD